MRHWHWHAALIDWSHCCFCCVGGPGCLLRGIEVAGWVQLVNLPGLGHVVALFLCPTLDLLLSQVVVYAAPSSCDPIAGEKI